MHYSSPSSFLSIFLRFFFYFLCIPKHYTTSFADDKSFLPQGPMTGSNSDRRGAQFCPKIESEDAYMILNGEAMQVQVLARNFAVSDATPSLRAHSMLKVVSFAM